METKKLNEKRKSYEEFLTKLGYKFNGIEEEDSNHIRVDYINPQLHSDLHIYFDKEIKRSYAYLLFHDYGKTLIKEFPSLNSLLKYFKNDIGFKIGEII